MMPRRPLLVCFTAILLIFHADPLKALEGGLPTSIQNLVGEYAFYSVDFLVFHRVAQAELRFSATDQPGIFRAELVGRTLGVISWLSGERTQSYTSLMELSPDGSLRTVEHNARILKRRRGRWQERLRHYRYDYEHGKILDEKARVGVPRELTEHDIPEGLHPVDMLTAFYNLRIGVYGNLERGSRILIPTYARGEFTEIEVRILTHEQQAKQNNFPTQGLLLQVTIDPEIFDTKRGDLYVWFNDAGVPGRGIVEDMIGAGDVLGYLDKEVL
jgi:hypothetical protein